jgi:hypothetical protein
MHKLNMKHEKHPWFIRDSNPVPLGQKSGALTTELPGHLLFKLSVSKTDTVQNEEPKIMDSSSAAWKRSKGMFDCKKVKWAINSFKPHKSAAPDQIFPALLKKMSENTAFNAFNLSAYV